MEVTRDRLEFLVNSINDMLGEDKQAIQFLEPFGIKWRTGTFVLNTVNNQYYLARVSNPEGGLTQIIEPCYRKDMYYRLAAFIRGLAIGGKHGIQG